MADISLEIVGPVRSTTNTKSVPEPGAILLDLFYDLAGKKQAATKPSLQNLNVERARLTARLQRCVQQSKVGQGCLSELVRELSRGAAFAGHISITVSPNPSGSANRPATAPVRHASPSHLRSTAASPAWSPHQAGDYSNPLVTAAGATLSMTFDRRHMYYQGMHTDPSLGPYVAAYDPSQQFYLAHSPVAFDPQSTQASSGSRQHRNRRVVEVDVDIPPPLPFPAGYSNVPASVAAWSPLEALGGMEGPGPLPEPTPEDQEVAALALGDEGSPHRTRRQRRGALTPEGPSARISEDVPRGEGGWERQRDRSNSPPPPGGRESPGPGQRSALREEPVHPEPLSPNSGVVPTGVLLGPALSVPLQDPTRLSRLPSSSSKGHQPSDPSPIRWPPTQHPLAVPSPSTASRPKATPPRRPDHAPTHTPQIAKKDPARPPSQQLPSRRPGSAYSVPAPVPGQGPRREATLPNKPWESPRDPASARVRGRPSPSPLKATTATETARPKSASSQPASARKEERDWDATQPGKGLRTPVAAQPVPTLSPASPSTRLSIRSPAARPRSASLVSPQKLTMTNRSSSRPVSARSDTSRASQRSIWEMGSQDGRENNSIALGRLAERLRRFGSPNPEERSPTLHRFGSEYSAGSYKEDDELEEWYKNVKKRKATRSFINRFGAGALRDLDWIKNRRMGQKKMIKAINNDDEVYLYHVRRWFAAKVIQRHFRNYTSHKRDLRQNLLLLMQSGGTSLKPYHLTVESFKEKLTRLRAYASTLSDVQRRDYMRNVQRLSSAKQLRAYVKRAQSRKKDEGGVSIAVSPVSSGSSTPRRKSMSRSRSSSPTRFGSGTAVVAVAMVERQPPKMSGGEKPTVVVSPSFRQLPTPPPLEFPRTTEMVGMSTSLSRNASIQRSDSFRGASGTSGPAADPTKGVLRGDSSRQIVASAPGALIPSASGAQERPPPSRASSKRVDPLRKDSALALGRQSSMPGTSAPQPKPSPSRSSSATLHVLPESAGPILAGVAVEDFAKLLFHGSGGPANPPPADPPAAVRKQSSLRNVSFREDKPQPATVPAANMGPAVAPVPSTVVEGPAA